MREEFFPALDLTTSACAKSPGQLTMRNMEKSNWFVLMRYFIPIIFPIYINRNADKARKIPI